jgi:hypothetical protein
VRIKLFVLLVVLAMAFAVIPVASAHLGPALSPTDVEVSVFPGADAWVEKTVHTPEIPPDIDICLVQDETGSFFDDIANLQNPATINAIYDGIKAGAPGAHFAVTGFRDYDLNPWGSPGDWVYRLLSSMSPTLADWTNGVNALVAGGGNDFPEAQYDAIAAAAGPGPTDYAPDSLGPQDDCGWRIAANVTRVMVVTTDASFHTPVTGTHANDHNSALLALQTANVVLIGLKAPGAGVELDFLAGSTGGSVQPLGSDGSNIVDAIFDALADIEVEVSMDSNCEWPISTSFDPDSIVVTSGEDAVFHETISVAPDAPGGTYTCEDWALIDGAPMVDAAGEIILERKTIHVPVAFLTGGGQIGNPKDGISFGGNVGYLADGSVVGQWEFQDHDKSSRLIMHSLNITAIQLSNDGDGAPDPPTAPANIVAFEGTARVKDGNDKWIDTCTFNAEAHDHGEPSVDDQFAIAINCGADGAWTYFPVADLEQGNLQIHEGPKG